MSLPLACPNADRGVGVAWVGAVYPIIQSSALRVAPNVWEFFLPLPVQLHSPEISFPVVFVSQEAFTASSPFPVKPSTPHKTLRGTALL